MHLLRKFLRWTFGVQTIVFGGLAVMMLVRHAAPANARQALFNISMPVLFTVIATLFGMAWWSTRRPSRTPQWWAIAACAAHLVFRFSLLAVEFFFGHTQLFTLSDILTPLLDLAGLIAFARGASEAELAPAAAPVQRAPIAGDRTARHAVKVVAAVSLVAQFLSVGLWWKYAAGHQLPYFLGSAFIVVALLADFLTAIVHECAHAVVAFAFRMRMLSFRIGPFRWQKLSGVWCFKFTPAGILNLGGAVGLVPTHADQPVWHEICVIAAGPLSNIVGGIVALSYALNTTHGAHVAVWRLAALIASSCFIAAIVNLIPFQSQGGAYSDGARLVQLLTASPVADLHKALLAIQSTAVTARRPRDQDAELLRRAIRICPADKTSLVLHLCVAYHYEDQGLLYEANRAFTAAEFFVRRSTLDVPPELLTAFVIDSAFLKRDASATRSYWNLMQSRNPTKINVDYWLADASLHWMEGRYTEAEKSLAKADAEAALKPDAGSYNFDRDRCVRLRRELNLTAVVGVGAGREANQPVYRPERRSVARAAALPGRSLWPRPMEVCAPSVG